MDPSVDVNISALRLARLFRALKRYAAKNEKSVQLLMLPHVAAALEAAGLRGIVDDAEARLTIATARHDQAEADAALAELAAAVPPGTIDEPE